MYCTVGVPAVMVVMGLFSAIARIPCALQLSADQQERVLQTCNRNMMNCHYCEPKYHSG